MLFFANNIEIIVISPLTHCVIIVVNKGISTCLVKLAQGPAS